jgi:hypothetical protein
MRNAKGQSTIEFILTFTATVGFIFLFLKMALNYTNGYIVQHAVFMASRSYLVHDKQSGQVPSEDTRDIDAATFAKAVFAKYLPAALINGFDGTLKFNDPGKMGDNQLTVFVGAFVEFTQAFSLGFVGGKERVKFRAESFLGREPTRFEGYMQTCDAISNVAGDCSVQVTLDDNGG